MAALAPECDTLDAVAAACGAERLPAGLEAIALECERRTPGWGAGADGHSAEEHASALRAGGAAAAAAHGPRLAAWFAAHSSRTAQLCALLYPDGVRPWAVVAAGMAADAVDYFDALARAHPAALDERGAAAARTDALLSLPGAPERDVLFRTDGDGAPRPARGAHRVAWPGGDAALAAVAAGASESSELERVCAARGFWAGLLLLLERPETIASRRDELVALAVDLGDLR